MAVQRMTMRGDDSSRSDGDISISKLRESFNRLHHRRTNSLDRIRLSYNTSMLFNQTDYFDEDLRLRRQALDALDVGLLALPSLLEEEEDDLVGLQFVSRGNTDWDLLSVDDDDDDSLSLNNSGDDDIREEPSSPITAKRSSMLRSPSSIIITRKHGETTQSNLARLEESDRSVLWTVLQADHSWRQFSIHYIHFIYNNNNNRERGSHNILN